MKMEYFDASTMNKITKSVQVFDGDVKLKYLMDFSARHGQKLMNDELKFILKRIKYNACTGLNFCEVPISVFAANYVIKKLRKLGYNIEVNDEDDILHISWN